MKRFGKTRRNSSKGFTLATRLLADCAGLVRMSSRSPVTGGFTSTTHRNPFQTTDWTFTFTAADDADSIASESIGTKHSCKLNPPCAYSLPAMKLATPGAYAT